MKRILLSVSLILISSGLLHSQLWKMRRCEVSGSIGTTQFFGDIGGFSKDENILGFKDILLDHTRFNINSAVRYRILNDVSAKFSLSMGSFHCTDNKGSNEGRKLESRTFFIEPALIGEFYFIKNKGEKSFLLMKGSSYPFPKRFFPMLDCYVFTGIGGLYYKVNPNDRLERRDLKTGGFTPVIPLGVGASFSYSGNYNFGLELGARYSFSDYVDGYTSAYSKSNDMYYLLNFIFIYKLRTDENGLPQFLNKRRNR